VIGDEIQRLERIVKDFLQFARPSEPQFIVTTADAVLQHIHELFRAQLDTSGIEIKLQPTPPLSVRVDPQQLEQVLINLVQNAAESIGHRGTITLRAFSTRAQLQGRLMAAVALEVSDTGKGIPADVQKRLFDPFFTTRATGTGLGLSIAARIVENHGGALQYQTELNRGTVFRVLLPAVENES
jgi:signal transduction histidine kinase